MQGAQRDSGRNYSHKHTSAIVQGFLKQEYNKKSNLEDIIILLGEFKKLEQIFGY